MSNYCHTKVCGCTCHNVSQYSHPLFGDMIYCDCPQPHSDPLFCESDKLKARESTPSNPDAPLGVSIKSNIT